MITLSNIGVIRNHHRLPPGHKQRTGFMCLNLRLTLTFLRSHFWTNGSKNIQMSSVFTRLSILFIVIQSIIETVCLATVYVQIQVQVQVRQCNLVTCGLSSWDEHVRERRREGSHCACAKKRQYNLSALTSYDFSFTSHPTLVSLCQLSPAFLPSAQ